MRAAQMLSYTTVRRLYAVKSVTMAGVMKTKIFAHYLPQFHRIKENSEWWSPGFTEWTNVSRARELFPGHYQPHVPADLGFYDLSTSNIMYEQADLAREYGVDGFNFYFYWFDGRRILEKPLENFLKSDINVEFSLCWANENWTRRWDGADKEVLLEQSYMPGFEVQLFADLLPFLKDQRYLRVDGKPVLSIYRAQEIPNVKKVFANLRKLAVEANLNGLHLIAVESFGLASPNLVGADAMMEFPPHGVGAECITAPPAGIKDNFIGQSMDYRIAIANASNKPGPNFTYYRGLMPSWDNTPRTGLRAHFFTNSSPQAFRVWMDFVLAWTRSHFNEGQQGLVFINAWNEWAEGAHLEPDLEYGRGYLEAVSASTLNINLSLEEARTAVNRLDIARQNPRLSTLRAQFRWAPSGGILGALFREINRNNFKQIIRLLKQDPSGGDLISAVSDVLRAIRRANNGKWKPSTYLKEMGGVDPEWEKKILITCHLHYPEYFDRFIRLVKQFSETMHFAVTSDDDDLVAKLHECNFTNVKVFKSQNRGRNFGPFLVELAQEIKRYKYVAHIHSKRSVHSSRNIARKWTDLHWNMLGENREVLRRTIGLFESDANLAIGYPLATDIIKASRFNWFKNKTMGQSWFEENEISFVEDPFPYPAGGMFILRSESFEKLFRKNWEYLDFPTESGQLDGTTQHMIERLMGALPIALGLKHLIYDQKADKFTSDSSYAQKYPGA